MTRTRIPWPWEGRLPPADAALLLKAWREHAAAAYPERELPSESPAMAADGGELSGVRDTRALMERRILDMTDETPAAREWAASKARRATARYDAGVRAGTQPPPSKR